MYLRIADRHDAPIKAAALQFSLAHPASAAIIPGASRPERIAEDHAALKATIPGDFWRDMRRQALVAANAPLPIDRERNGLAEASASIDVSASRDQVWRLIGGFGSLPDWLPYIPKSELSAGGRVRHLANLRGDTIVERLEEFNDAARTYSYSILQAPFPVSGYLATLRVQQAANGNGSRVEWSGKFTPEGVSAMEASRLFRRMFEDGLKALANKFT